MRKNTNRFHALYVAGMPCLRRLSVRGALGMAVSDRSMADDDENYDNGAYSYAVPPILRCVLHGLPVSVEFLDLDDCHVGNGSNFELFCDEFVRALTADRFRELKEVSMRSTYELMPQVDGVPLMAALGLSSSLRRVFLGAPMRFKKWQHTAAHDLRDARPDVLVLCV